MRPLGFIPFAAPLLAAIAGCGPIQIDSAPSADFPSQCESQVYADPTVKDLLMKSAGSITFARDHEDQLKYAKLDAAHRCLQNKGIIPQGGGVERPAVRN